MTTKNEINSKLIIILFVIILIALGIYNIIINTSFFKLKISDLANISITLFIATYLFKLQSRNGRRREHCIDLIDKLMAHLDIYTFSDCNSDNLMNDKKISQLVSLIEIYNKDFQIEAEMKIIMNYTELYRKELSKVIDQIITREESNLNIKNLKFDTIHSLEKLKIKILN